MVNTNRRFHIFPTSEGYNLFSDDMEYIIPRPLSLNLLTSEINKYDEGSVVVYYVDRRAHFQTRKVVIFNKQNPFTGNLT